MVNIKIGRRIAAENPHRGILPFGDSKQTHGAMFRQIVFQPLLVLVRRFHAAANADINRILQHIVPVVQQELAEARRFLPLARRPPASTCQGLQWEDFAADRRKRKAAPAAGKRAPNGKASHEET